MGGHRRVRRDDRGRVGISVELMEGVLQGSPQILHDRRLEPPLRRSIADWILTSEGAKSS
jgi:hypothetical protein